MNAVIDHPLVTCEKEALAFSGHIQAHGALLFIDRTSGTFTHASANCEAVLGQAPEALLGQNAGAWMAQHILGSPKLSATAGKREELPNAIIRPDISLDLLVSTSGSGWLLEFELSASDAELTTLNAAHPPLTAPMDTAGLHQLQDSLVQGIAALTGYDRVMLYRFHADWSGEVVAEAVQGAYGSYMGLRFPASDIPSNARALYAQTPYRHIPDVSAQAVALLSLKSAGDPQLLDIAWSDLRSVSPMHLQYLQNMQVAASYSVSVMVGGKLWGLLACHHHQPRLLAVPVRHHSARLARDFSTALQGFEVGQRRRAHQAALNSSKQLHDATQAQSLTSAMVSQSDALLQLFQSASGLLVQGGDVTALGAADASPANDFVQALHQWCQQHQGESELTCDHLPPELEPLAQVQDNPVRGFMSVRLNGQQSGKTRHVYWLRHEEAQEIAWAGNPDKPVEQAAEGLRISPRNSFDKWVEVRRGYCAPWREETVFAARQWREQMVQWI